MSNSTHLPDDELPTILTGALIEALGQVGAALAIVDRSGEVTHKNDGMRELSRHGNGPRMPEELLTRVLEDGETITDAEFALARLEGLSAPMRWSSWPVHDAGDASSAPRCSPSTSRPRRTPTNAWPTSTSCSRAATTPSSALTRISG